VLTLRWKANEEWIGWPINPVALAKIKTFFERAGIEQTPDGVVLDHFYAYAPRKEMYMCVSTRELWPAKSVDARVRAPVPKMKASTWLDRNRSIEQITWAPGMPMLIKDRCVLVGGWIEQPGYKVYNLYLPPGIEPGDANQAGPWLDLLRKVYPSDADHVVNFLAHRRQRPGEKINHGLVLGGDQGIGKDTILEPVKRAVGPWNVHEVSPQKLLGRFNPHVKSVILRVSEARDLGEFNRFALYESTKTLLAAPPDVITCDEKNLREHAVFNICGVIITTNRKDSLYLPSDDRRHYVAWSDLTREHFPEAEATRMWRWYDAGGDRHVAAFLDQVDLSSFNAKAPPPKTDVFWEIVHANETPEDAELNEALDALGRPNAVISPMIVAKARQPTFALWLEDRKNARAVPHRLEACGYVYVKNELRKDGRWVIPVCHYDRWVSTRLAVYARKDLTYRERYIAAAALQAEQEAEARKPGAGNGSGSARETRETRDPPPAA
jgi:hypothetical protein